MAPDIRGGWLKMSRDADRMTTSWQKQGIFTFVIIGLIIFCLYALFQGPFTALGMWIAHFFTHK